MTDVRNLQGDVSAIIDGAGNVVAEYRYDAWGNHTYISDTEIANINPIRYRGYYWDSESQLYYLQSRYYCPQLRRFISADVYLDTGVGILGTNVYIYCNNDPVNFVDPTGYSPVRTRGTYMLTPTHGGLWRIDGLDHARFATEIYLMSMGFRSIDFFNTLNVEVIRANQFGVLHGRATFEAEGREWTFEFVFGQVFQVRNYENFLFNRKVTRAQDSASTMDGLFNDDFLGMNLNSLTNHITTSLINARSSRSFIFDVLRQIPIGGLENMFIFIPIQNITSRNIR